MPIFWLTTASCGSERILTSSPRHMRSIEIAASWPCATAQMMFFGPKAASPPKNTWGWLDAMVLGSTLGMSHLSNSMPQSRSIHGNAGRHQVAPPVGVAHCLDLLEGHAGELAVVERELLRHQIIEDRDVFVHGVLLLPRGRLHLLEAGANHHLYVLAAEPARGPAAFHRCVTAAE